MASKIEWTDETWNPIRARNRATGGVGHYCAKVSAGCQGCYAERMQRRFNNPVRYAAQDRDRVDIFLDEAVLLKPLAWKKPRVVFPCSMTDLFGDWVTDAMLDRLFAVMALAPQHTFKILTKRPERMWEYMERSALSGAKSDGRLPKIWHAYKHLGGKWGDFPMFPLHNVQLGVSVEDQESADARIPVLLATPAATRIVSYEPALGPVDFMPYLLIVTHADDAVLRAAHQYAPAPVLPFNDPATTPPEDISSPRVDQVIAGGQSGPGAQPSHPDWFRSARDQCVAAGVPFFFKQWGEWIDERQATAQGCAPGPEMFDAEGMPAGPRWHFYDPDDPVGGAMIRVGKKAAGRLLDGAIWDQQP